MKALVAWTVVGSVAVGLLALAPPLVAGPPAARTFLAVRMTGAQEVPARDTAGHGVAVFHLNRDETELSVSVVAHLVNLVGGHVHSAPEGVNGPIILPFLSAAPGGGPFDGLAVQETIVRGVTPLPASLGAALDDAQRFDELIVRMRSGDTYVNLHTDDGVAPPNTGSGDFPGGEIRAQVVPRP